MKQFCNFVNPVMVAVTYCFILLASFQVIVQGYPRGAPSLRCLYPIPSHAVQGEHGIYEPQETTSSYYIDFSQPTYAPNEVINVTVKNELGPDFKGFLLRAVRTQGNTQELIGEFIDCTANPSNATAKAVTVYSGSTVRPCATHGSKTPKQNVTCRWRAPSTRQGDLRFGGVVVQSYNTYWLDVQNVLKDADNSTYDAISPWAEMSDKPNQQFCEKSHGCVVYPRLCESSGTCSHMVAYEKDGTNYKFVVYGALSNEDNKYIAMGLSTDKEMGGDAIIACTINPYTDMVNILQFGSPADKKFILVSETPPLSAMSAGLFRSTFRRRIIACAFTIPAKFTSMGAEWDLNANEHHLFLADGETYKNSYIIKEHVARPLISEEKIMLSETKISFFMGLEKKVQIHATIALTGWMGLAILGIVIARHYRPVFNTTAIGKPVWLVLHMLLMPITFILGLTAIIYICVKNGEWDSETQAHGALGIAATCCAFINIVSGLFRPHPGDRYRHAFNIFHRAMGIIGLIFATITFWISLTLEGLREEFKFWMIICFGVWTGITYILMIVFECFRKSTFNKYQVEESFNIELKKRQDGEEDTAPTKSGKFVPHVGQLWLFLLIVGVWGCVAACYAGLWLH